MRLDISATLLINLFKRWWKNGNSNGRLQEIDIVRGITIFLVVLGHVGISNSLLAEVLGDFRMPLFFVLSGYLFSTSKYLENPKTAFKRKVTNFIDPIYFFLPDVCSHLVFGINFAKTGDSMGENQS